MENYWRFIDRNKTYIVIMSLFILSSCTTDRMDRQMMDESYYSQAAVITGHIANREVYPNTNEISITLPFYDRVDSRQTSLIYDDEFGFSVLPYAPRTVSMAPFVDHMVICPGDSIHVELDFAELGKVSFSGTGADNNVKMNEFHLKSMFLNPICS